jgi:hypothetical protein
MRPDDFAARQREQQRQAENARAAANARAQQAQRAQDAANRAAEQARKRALDDGQRAMRQKQDDRQKKLNQQQEEHDKYMKKRFGQKRVEPYVSGGSRPQLQPFDFQPELGRTESGRISKPDNSETKQNWDFKIGIILSLLAGSGAAYLVYTTSAAQPNAAYWAIGLFGCVSWITDRLLKGPLHFLLVTLRVLITWTLYAAGVASILYFIYLIVDAVQKAPQASQ